MLSRQTRTGTYGSWYNYYLCDFSGAIILPDLPNVPGLAQIQENLKNMSFHSTAERCKD
jgi:phospholipid/cholesterol/gamma-HCH transport system substrate-binding protein